MRNILKLRVGALFLFLITLSMISVGQEKSQEEKLNDLGIDPATISEIMDVEDASDVKEKVKIDYSADNASPESVINAFYETISGNADVERDIHRLYNLFTSNARILPGFWYGNTHLNNITIHPLVFFMELESTFEEDGLHNEVIRKTIDEFGFMAQSVVTSKVSFDPATGNDMVIRSIASIQLVKDYQGKWKIIQLMFQDEIDDFKIPAKYLPE